MPLFILGSSIPAHWLLAIAILLVVLVVGIAWGYVVPKVARIRLIIVVDAAVTWVVMGVRMALSIPTFPFHVLLGLAKLACTSIDSLVVSHLIVNFRAAETGSFIVAAIHVSLMLVVPLPLGPVSSSRAV